MPDGSGDALGTLVRDSARNSLVITLPIEAFIVLPLEERRSSGVCRCVSMAAPTEFGLAVDRIVTCVMVLWAVTIFVGMSYLAAVI